MFTSISVLVPTRNRPERLRTLLESFLRTVGDFPGAGLVFRLDDDDRSSYELLAGRAYPVVVGPRLGGYASMPTFFNELAAAATGDVLVCGNDDMVFKSPGWAQAILSAANHYPDGLFDFGVTTHNAEHYPFSIVSKKVVERLGFLWDPRIFWGDIYLRDVMSHFGRCVMLPEIEIEHDWAGFKPDTVFYESDKDITGKDPSYWQVTHRLAVADAIAKLEGATA